MILGDLTQQHRTLSENLVSIPRARYINGVVPASAAAVILQSAAVVHDHCSLRWDAGRNLSVQTQHPLPPPLAQHHLPSAQTECQSLGGPQGARSRMQEGTQKHAFGIYLWGQKSTEGLREGTASLWWHILASTQASELIFG